MLNLEQVNKTYFDSKQITSINGIELPKTYTKIKPTKYMEQFYIYTNDTIIGRSIDLYGEYTELEIQLLRNFLNDESIVYDIGANIGYHTVAFSVLAKHVYAFEPNKKNIDLLHKNTDHLKNVEIHEVAVGNNNETVLIEDFDLDRPGNYGELHIKDVGIPSKCVRLDDVDDIYYPDLIKIDVEGYELHVLRGAINTIKEVNPIIFYEAHGSDLPEIYDFLTDLGYTLYWYPCPNFNPNNFYKNAQNVFGQGGVVNVLALPKTKPIVSNLEKYTHRLDSIFDAVRRFHENNKK